MVRILFVLLCAFGNAAWAAEPDSLDVPFVRQVYAGCGSASLAMVMQYWVRNDQRLDPAAADAERIHKALPVSSKGIPGSQLKQYLEANGFTAFVFDGELQDLQNHLAKGRPVVVCLAPRGLRAPLHYVVVTAARAGDSSVVVNDPARGKSITIEADRFLREWKATGNWALLAVPAQAR
jgi:ABC-type bacteriocin/lantibiotic exporter with double-glycine peptidase domain